MDLQGAPYGYPPMGDDSEDMEGFRFWKQGYWKDFLRGRPYHISALYVVDLNRFRQVAAGDRLRGQYQGLSADPNSLSNLDQDLPNNCECCLCACDADNTLPMLVACCSLLTCLVACSTISIADSHSAARVAMVSDLKPQLLAPPGMLHKLTL